LAKNMKWNCKLRSLGAIFSLLSGALWAEAQAPAIIPLPQEMEVQPGSFVLRAHARLLGAGTKIVVSPGAEETGRYLAAELRRRTLAELEVMAESKAPASGNIELRLEGTNSEPGAEGYTLTVAPKGVMIQAGSSAGLFYGVQSFLQLLPVPNEAGRRPTSWLIPCVQVADQPRFRWRGLMLDVSRHFFTKEEVERLLDEMAWHKLNVFHWHLVDDQGWRIEIKKYPRLTEVGAWRKAIGFGLDAKAGTAYGPDGRYGGYYTQEDIREVVAYAQVRHIEMVPEIEMPGHSSAALMAYPQFSCTGGPFTTDLPGGVFNGVYCAGNDDSFVFVEDVLTEVCALFPGPYIHIGGDEVLVDNWKNCPKCQARMRQEGLTKESELEGYFIRRVEKIINAHHRRLVGWSEIRQGGLAANATVMDWVGGAVEAATAGHDVVMSPLADCYFDHYQSLDQTKEPHAIGGYLPLRQVYAFEPVPTNLPAPYQQHILGAQANVWTEYMPSFEHVEYMVFPRLCALAEVVWSPKASRHWDDFARRVRIDGSRLDQLGVNHRALSTIAEEPLVDP
jgi:hexosaminidase